MEGASDLCFFPQEKILTRNIKQVLLPDKINYSEQMGFYKAQVLPGI